MSDPAEQMAYEAGLDTAHGGNCVTEHDLCDQCNHPMHSGLCEQDRTIECGGIEIDGTCGCPGDSDQQDLIAAKRKVERALFINGGLRNFLTVRRGA